MPKNQNGSSSKTSRASLIATKEKISNFSSSGWMNSGTAFHGEYSMQNILEHPKDAEESSLSEVLEASAPLKYFLKKDHLKSLLVRALARSTPMPKELKSAIKNQISTLSSTQLLEENQKPARKQKATATTAKRTRSTAEVVPMLYVRRLMPSECETLQGFPKGWTEIDTGR